MIKLVVGLGNPGRKYSNTRHNLGFMVLDRIVEKFESRFKKKGDFRQSSVSIGGRNILLIKPLTFMNLSGEAVREASEYHGINPDEILVVCDDINLPLGRIRIRQQGSDGGHKGLKSIIGELRSPDFPRLRMGVGMPEEPECPVEAFVLEKFRKDEKEIVEEMISEAASAVETLILDGVEIAQQKYN